MQPTKHMPKPMGFSLKLDVRSDKMR